MSFPPCNSVAIGYYAEAIVETIREPLLILDGDLCVKSANRAFYKLFCTSLEETRDKRIFELGNGQWDIPSLRSMLEEVLPTDESIENFEVTHDFPTIGRKIMQLNARRLIKPEDRQPLVLLAIEDITVRRQAEDALFAEKELAQHTLRAIADGVITTDAAGNVDYLNPAAEHLTGWRNTETQRLPLDQVFRLVNETTRDAMNQTLSQLIATEHASGLPAGTLLLSRDGREYAIEDSTAPIRGRNGTIAGIVLVFRDVTSKQALIREVSHQAEHDYLTGLLNRQGFETVLEELLQEAHVSDKHHALLYLDLDQFKIVNDTCGHDAGDALLRELAALLQSKMRQADTVGRLGGDEFGILLYGCQGDEAQRIAQFLVETVRRFRFVWNDRVFSIGVSIGLVLLTEEIRSINSVLNAADTACYMAKNRGRNRIEQCAPQDVEELRWHREMSWATRIHEAFEQGYFQLYYQKIKHVSLTETPSNEHQEILLRMVDAQGQVIEPMAFIPAAERYDLMTPIDRWVVKTLFDMLAAHFVVDGVPTSIGNRYSVNLSGQSISDPHFLDFVEAEFERTRIPANVIYFEVTETAAIRNLLRATTFIRTLQARGCCFVLDDFGNGLSSFAYLKQLPVDQIKIDGLFVKDMTKNRIDFAMVDAIQRVSKEMKIRTIAEYVESHETMEELRKIGVDYAQGFALHRPEFFQLQ